MLPQADPCFFTPTSLLFLCLPPFQSLCFCVVSVSFLLSGPLFFVFFFLHLLSFIPSFFPLCSPLLSSLPISSTSLFSLHPSVLLHQFPSLPPVDLLWSLWKLSTKSGTTVLPCSPRVLALWSVECCLPDQGNSRLTYSAATTSFQFRLKTLNRPLPDQLVPSGTRQQRTVACLFCLWLKFLDPVGLGHSKKSVGL